MALEVRASSLTADMKKIYISPMYSALSDGFIDYLYLLCWRGASNNGLLSIFKMADLLREKERENSAF